MDELVALVGGSWQPLLLYPGALAGLLMTFVMRILWSGRARAGWRSTGRPGWDRGTIPAVACGLLLLALLPFPRSYWAYPVDVVVALALLEAPCWYHLARRMRSVDGATQLRAAEEAGSILNAYLLLAVAVAAVGQASGSLLLTEVKGAPQPLRLAGLITWGLTLPPLLAFGPWRSAVDDDWPADLRRVGHIALLVAVALPPGDQWGHGTTAIAAAIAFGSLTLLHHLWRGRPASWERLQPAIALALLAFLLYSNVQAWLTRMR